jgi:hypothetical protein
LFASRHFGGESKNGLEQAMLWIADRELCRVNPNREPSGAGRDVVARQRSLAALV